MSRNFRPVLVTALATALALSAGDALPQQSKGGKIVCWKDKAGKVVGCGDTVPPEYQDAATRELDRRGVTRKTTGSVEEEARRQAEAEELKKQQAEQRKKQDEQRRRDMALLNTYVSETEIDQRRDRELQEVDRLLTQFRGLHKSATARHTDAAGRLAAAEKAGKPADAIKDEVTRAEAEKAKLERGIATRETEKEEIRARYAETRRRFTELKGGGASAAAPAPTPAKK
jgi:DNA repair exonuclease SbcCD ATPase subunit